MCTNHCMPQTFVVTISQWRLLRRRISQILVGSNMTSAEKQIWRAISVIRWPSWLAFGTKKQTRSKTVWVKSWLRRCFAMFVTI